MLRKIAFGLSSSVLFLSCTGLPSIAAEFEGHCRLLYKGKVVVKGECTAEQNGDIVNVKGPEFQAVINNQENTGVLIGANKFILSEGKLVSNENNVVGFSNHYRLRMKVSPEEAAEGTVESFIEELFK